MTGDKAVEGDNDTPERRSFLQGYRQGKKDPLTGVFATRSAALPHTVTNPSAIILNASIPLSATLYVGATHP